MVRVQFTDNIQRHVACPPQDVEGHTVREAIDAYFEDHPEVRGYVLDDQGALRKHMVVFVDGKQISDREHLQDPAPPDGLIDVIQALSGG